MAKIIIFMRGLKNEVVRISYFSYRQSMVTVQSVLEIHAREPN